jgi:class 3 adenylate cyclase
MKAITYAFATLRNSILVDSWSRWIGETRADAGSLLAAYPPAGISGRKCITGKSEPAARRPVMEPRRLVTVVYADMVGYSRLIGLDDTGTLMRLRQLRASIIDHAIEDCGGMIIQTGGDSLLMVFESVNRAVDCAANIQRAIPAHDGEQPFEMAIRFRMTVNVGDAIFDGNDLHGNVVNVAVRLQAVCPPGGICITRAVYELLQRHDVYFQGLGPLNLKNIRRPVEAYVATLPGATYHRERDFAYTAGVEACLSA